MQYKWGIIGCGHIANEMAEAMQDFDGHFYGIYSRTKEKAEKFAQKHQIKKVYSSAEELINDKDIEIIYIATPHNTHINYLRQALNAGKHILCEKAITLNSEELEEAIKIAEENNLILAEAMTIFHCPVYDKIKNVIQSGKLGKLKTIQVNLGSCKDYDMSNRFFNMSLAGGAMLDIGVYALSFARFFLNERPDKVFSQMQKAPTGADEQVNMILENALGEMATVTLSLRAKLPRLGVVGFENGYITVDNYNRSRKAEIFYNDDTKEVFTDNDTLSCLAHEILDMEKAVSGKENKMHLDFTCAVMQIMTDVRHNHKMYYPEEINI